MAIKRRDLLQAMAAAPAGMLLARVPVAGHELPYIVSRGIGEDNLAYDDAIRRFMVSHDVPGCALAVLDKGRTVYTRGYGYADQNLAKPFTPHSVIRLGTLTRPLTATAILQLVQRGTLNLDAPVFALLGLKSPAPTGKAPDARIYDVTVEQCLRMTAGWDEKKRPRTATRAALAEYLHFPPNCGPKTLVRMLMAEILDFTPGRRQGYADEGYVCLGRVLEKVTGKSYFEAMRDLVARPAGLESLVPARSRPADRCPEEVRYYEENEVLLPSLFPEDGGRLVKRPDGALNLEAVDSAAGLACSLEDYARFVEWICGSKSPLSVKTQEMILEPPDCLTDPEDLERYYGMGWFVVEDEEFTCFEEVSNLPGSCGYVRSLPNGKTLLVLCNTNNATLNRLDRLIPRLKKALLGR